MNRRPVPPESFSAGGCLSARWWRFPIIAGRIAITAACAATTRALSRARADFEELAETLIHHRPETVTDINIQSGEDALAAREVVLPLIRILRRRDPARHQRRPGTHDYPIYRELKEAGASLYILKYETADALDYRRKQAPGSLSERVKHIRWLAAPRLACQLRFHCRPAWTGGVPFAGRTTAWPAVALRGCSVSPFVPGSDTPWLTRNPADVETVLNLHGRPALDAVWIGSFRRSAP